MRRFERYGGRVVVVALHRRPAPGERDHRRHRRHVVATVHRSQRARRWALGRSLGLCGHFSGSHVDAIYRTIASYQLDLRALLCRWWANSSCAECAAYGMPVTVRVMPSRAWTREARARTSRRKLTLCRMKTAHRRHVILTVTPALGASW